MAYVYKIMASPVGRLKLVASARGLAGILWENEKENRVPHVGAAREVASHPCLQETERQLTEYFARTRTRFDLPLDLVGNDFQKRVWNLLMAIPYGETRSYGELARQLESPLAARAVGAANRCNPVSIVAPCHRVIGADGTLTGFAGGLEAKRYLLELEGAELPAPVAKKRTAPATAKKRQEKREQRLEGFLKGDLAESIVSRMFHGLHFQVQYSGMEVNNPLLAFLQRMNQIEPATIHKQTFAPDLTLIRAADERYPRGFCMNLEVKYRGNGKINRKKLLSYSEDTHFLLLDGEHFWYIAYRDLLEAPYNQQQTLKFKTMTLLEKDPRFRFSEKDEEIIRLCKSYASFLPKLVLQETRAIE